MAKIQWVTWYEELKSIARNHEESVADQDAWREEFDLGKTPEEAFFEEFPEHRPE